MPWPPFLKGAKVYLTGENKMSYKLSIDFDGTKVWTIEGKYHKEDGPTVIHADDCKEWFFNDKLHRADGPAIEYPNGGAEWWLHGRLHRIDGPAIEFADGYKEWFICGKEFPSEEEFIKFKQLRLLEDL
jgi:hypothetical protein